MQVIERCVMKQVKHLRIAPEASIGRNRCNFCTLKSTTRIHVKEFKAGRALEDTTAHLNSDSYTVSTPDASVVSSVNLFSSKSTYLLFTNTAERYAVCGILHASKWLPAFRPFGICAVCHLAVFGSCCVRYEWRCVPKLTTLVFYSFFCSLSHAVLALCNRLGRWRNSIGWCH